MNQENLFHNSYEAMYHQGAELSNRASPVETNRTNISIFENFWDDCSCC